MYKVKFVKIKSFFSIILALLFVSGPTFLFAEMQIEVQPDEINIEISPNNPEPYQNVTIRISSYATDLNKAIIRWQGPSGVVSSGIGKTSYSFTTGRPGSINIFDISITPVGSMSTITKRVTVAPSEVEIMWESADGYTPPFYKGRSLPVNGGRIRAVAIPNTDTIKSGIGSITYTWKNNGETLLNSSGYNKNYYIFKNNVFSNTNEVTVIASSVENNYSAEKTVSVPLYDPKIIFYKKSPSEGILYENALNKETYMPEDEMTIVAEPYYMSIKNSMDDNLSYNWQINGGNISTPAKRTELTVRPASHGGFATINLNIENLKELFQSTNNQLKINL